MLARALLSDWGGALDEPAALLQWTQGVFAEGLLLIAPVVMASMAIGALTAFIDAGPVFAPEFVKPQLARLNPFSGTKRLFSLRSAMELIKLVIKTVMTGLIAV